MHHGLCVCALIPRLETRTRLLLIIHRFEDYKPSNTGRLAAECLVHSKVLVRGGTHGRDPALEIAPDSEPLLLFPAADAVALEELAPSLTKPVTLIVPDGSWRQAARVRRRVPGLRDVRCVMLRASSPSLYRLRAESHRERVSTLEAIARAFGILEGPDVQRAIELPFRAMVERTLWMRGKLEANAVTGGIPAQALRHHPESGTGGRSS